MPSNLVNEQTLYRSYTEDSQLWCETWNRSELINRSVGAPSTLSYEMVTIRTVEEIGEWEEFTPDPSEFVFNVENPWSWDGTHTNG